MDIQELKQVMQQNGIIGAGGAGFPSYAKLDKRIDTVILNCAECEPLLKVHRQLLAKNAYEILEALAVVAQAVEAKEVIIAVKKAYRKTVDAVTGVLDGKNYEVPVRIGFLPEVYPAGDEVITIYETTGKVVPPGKIPIEVGVAVFNVETMYNVYRAVFQHKPVTHKYLTIAGEVVKPKTVRVPIGTRIEEVVALAGGITTDKPAYIHGGPMTGPVASPETLIGKTSNAILVLPEEHMVIRKKQAKTSVNMKRAMASCCQCRMCTDLCPRHLLGHPIEPHAFMRSATTGVTENTAPFLNTYFCSACGLCEMFSCNQGLTPRTLIGACKDGLRKNGVKPPQEVCLKPVDAHREERKVPMQRLTARLTLSKYDVEAPLKKTEAVPETVKIALNQHIGAPAEPTVQKGDIVKTGQKIADAKAESLSVCYHASVSGTVLEVNDKYVILKTDRT